MEPELEVLSVDDTLLSNKKLRLKLLENLFHSPPPAPLHWTTFKEFVDRRFKLFYPEKIIRDVFCLVDRTLAKNDGVCTYINLDSDSESEEYTIYSSPKLMNTSCAKSSIDPQDVANLPLNKCSETEDNEIPSSDHPSNKSCPTNGHDDANELTPLESAVSRISPKKMEQLQNDATVKKHGRLVKEIYQLLNEIRETTSCTLCTKLRNRIDKFKKYVGEECELLKIIAREDSEETRNGACSDVPNKVGNGHHKNSKRRSSLSNTGPLDSTQRVVLTEKHAEMIRRDILAKKLVEFCLPEILKNNERLNLTPPASLAPEEVQRAENETMRVKKRRSRSSKERRISGCEESVKLTSNPAVRADCDQTEQELVTDLKKKLKKKRAERRDSVKQQTSDNNDATVNTVVRNTRSAHKRCSSERELAASTPKKNKEHPVS